MTFVNNRRKQGRNRAETKPGHQDPHVTNILKHLKSNQCETMASDIPCQFIQHNQQNKVGEKKF